MPERKSVEIIPPDVLLSAYAQGYFPMGDESGEIGWYAGETGGIRGVIPIEDFHVSRRLERELRSHQFEIRIDSAFAEVIAGCAHRKETWINDVILRSYEVLHLSGYAHSIEAWREGQLQGGVYGVALGGAFFAESMFYRSSGASKAALVALVDRLRRRKFQLLDVQMVTPTSQRFGAVYVSRREYLGRLHRALQAECVF